MRVRTALAVLGALMMALVTPAFSGTLVGSDFRTNVDADVDRDIDRIFEDIDEVIERRLDAAFSERILDEHASELDASSTETLDAERLSEAIVEDEAAETIDAEKEASSETDVEVIVDTDSRESSFDSSRDIVSSTESRDVDVTDTRFEKVIDIDQSFSVSESSDFFSDSEDVTADSSAESERLEERESTSDFLSKLLEASAFESLLDLDREEESLESEETGEFSETETDQEALAVEKSIGEETEELV